MLSEATAQQTKKLFGSLLVRAGQLTPRLGWRKDTKTILSPIESVRRSSVTSVDSATHNPQPPGITCPDTGLAIESLSLLRTREKKRCFP